MWIKHLEIKKQTALIHILSKACSDHPYNMLFKYIFLTGHMPCFEVLMTFLKYVDITDNKHVPLYDAFSWFYHSCDFTYGQQLVLQTFSPMNID